MTTQPHPPAPSDPLVVAVDGPSGSGKSSVSRTVAQRLGLAYLDTGAMYRAVTWWCRQQGIDLDDLAAVATAAVEIDLRMGTDPSSPSVQVAGVVVDEAIRTTEISESVSRVAVNLDVRDELIRRQREIIAACARRGGVVAEGRDLTTVVMPAAPVRILLLASEDARLRRRALQVHGEAHQAAVSATHQQVVQRDQVDATVSSFMVAAPGVTTIDTSDLDMDGAVAAVLAVVAARTGVPV